MPKREDHEVKRGARVRLTLPKGTTARILGPGESEEEKGALWPSDSDDDLYAPRVAPRIEFYDLGTRLQSLPASTDFSDNKRTRAIDATSKPEPDDDHAFVNDYLEIAFDAEADDPHQLPTDLPQGVFDPYSFTAYGAQASLADATQLDWDKKCLGSRAPGSHDELDPLKSTRANGSSRRLPNCAPVWYGPAAQPPNRAAYHQSAGFQNDLFDLIFYRTGEPAKIYPNALTREIVRDIRLWPRDTFAGWSLMDIRENKFWQKRKEKDTDADERWSPLASSQGRAFEQGLMKFTGESFGSGYHLKIDSRLLYEPFDTGDLARFKITGEPNFEAEEKPLTFSPTTFTKIFLKPQWVCFAKQESWIYDGQVNIETYRFSDFDFSTSTFSEGFDHMRVTSFIATGGITLSVLPIPDPAADVGDHTIVATSNGDGTVSLSGGTGSLSGGEGTSSDTFIKGLRITIHVSGTPAAGVTATYNIVPDWRFVAVNVFTTARILKGFYAGRWPVVPRSNADAWDSVITFNGTSDYSTNDTFYNLTLQYKTAIAQTKPGRNVGFVQPFGGVYGKAIYERHASRDKHRFVYQVYPANAMQLSVANHRTLTVAEARTVFGSSTANAATYPTDDALAALRAQGAADAAQLLAALTGFAWIRAYTGSPVIVAGAGVLDDRKFVVAIPPTRSPAGTLCAVVQTAKSVRYIWRRVAEDREKKDADRDQGGFRTP